MFKKVFTSSFDGERFLMVQEDSGSRWSITGGYSESFIQSGRATNSPSSSEAEANVLDGQTGWRYNDGQYGNGVWKEADINVTCM